MSTTTRTRWLPDLSRLVAFADRRRHELAIAAVALLAHGLLLINNGIFWDDWLNYTHIRNGQYDLVNRFAEQVGQIPVYVYIWIAAANVPPDAIGFRLVALLLVVGCALALYSVCVSSGMLSRTDSALVAALAAAYPADNSYLMLSILNYLVFYLLFLGGVAMLLKAELASGRRRLLLRVLPLPMLFLSFGLNSLLVVYLGVLLLGAVHIHRVHSAGLRQLITRELPRRLDLVLLPVAYWIVYRGLFPPNGLYGDYYHQIQLSARSLAKSYAAFWSYGVATQFRDSIAALVAVPLLWLLVVVAAHRLWPRTAMSRPGGSIAPVWMLGFGALLFILAVFPYAAVVLYPVDRGPSSRDAILLGAPVALMLVGGVRILFANRAGGIGRVGGAILATLVTGFILVSAMAYIEWEARWVKDSSIIANLAATPGDGDYSVYWVDDSYQVGPVEAYRFDEWASIFEAAFGGQTRIGIDTDITSPTYLQTGQSHFIDFYNLSHLDPAGCQAKLSITAGPERHSSVGLVARYIYYSLFDTKDRDAFLRGITRVQVTAQPSPSAVHCASS